MLFQGDGCVINQSLGAHRCVSSADDETSSGEASSLGGSALAPVCLRPLVRQAGSIDDIEPAPYFTWQPVQGGLLSPKSPEALLKPYIPLVTNPLFKP